MPARCQMTSDEKTFALYYWVGCYDIKAVKSG